MPIKAICPECETEHQVEESLRGQRMICTNRSCRHVFTVGGEVTTPVPTPTPNPTPPANAWETPPPVRTPGTPTPTSNGTPTPTPTPTPPVPLEPPPVRKVPRTTDPGKRKNPAPPTSTGTPLPTPTPAPAPTPAPKAKPKPGRWAGRIILVSFVGVIGILGGAGYWAYTVFTQTEEKLTQNAEASYKSGNWLKAKEEWGLLQEKFPDSSKKDEYRLKEQLCRTLADFDSPGVALDLSLIGLEKYLKSEEGRDKIIAPFYPDLGGVVERRVKEFANRVVPAQDETPLVHITRAEEMVERLEKLKPPGVTPPQAATIRAEGARVEASVHLLEVEKRFAERLKQFDNTIEKHEVIAGTLKHFDAVIAEFAKLLPGLANRSEVQAARMSLYQAQLEEIVFAAAPDNAGVVPVAAPVPDPTRNLYVHATLKEPGKNAVRKTDDIVLALARGVLYALRQDNGKVVWARRVGIDTTTLPVRVRGNENRPPIILVLTVESMERATLTALDNNGRLLWRHEMNAPCLGRPVVVGDRAYLATFKGEVQEIELSRGRLLGTFNLGQRLTMGGVRQKGTTRIYFAAEDSCVYVLDVDPRERRCVAILHTRHPAGSLRAAPILLPGNNLSDSGFLVLTMARSLKETGLRVFHLPRPQNDAADLALASLPADGRDFWQLKGDRQRAWPADVVRVPRPDVVLGGWTWFPPTVDPEKLALLSEDGLLGLVGITQRNTRDPILFPYLPDTREGLPLAGLFGDGPLPHGRAQVVRMRGGDLWLLAGGRLQRARLGWNAGPKLVAVWTQPRDLGEPLHRGQALPDPLYQDAPPVDPDDPVDPEDVDGRAILYLTTQPLDRPGAIVSAIEDDTGKVLWQTQLGLVAAAAPVRLQPQAGPETLVFLDQCGALHQIPANLAPGKEPWQGLETLLAPSLADNPRWRPRLIALPDGRSAVQVAVQVAGLGEGSQLVLRLVTWDGNKDLWTVETQTFDLKGNKTLAGMPARVAGHLVLPLSDGVLYRVPIPFGNKPELKNSSNWRDPYARPDAHAVLLALGDDRFACSDGADGLTVYEWPALPDAPARSLPLNRPRRPDGQPKPTYTLSLPLVGTPLILPAGGGKLPRLLLADQAGTLLCLESQKDGGLTRRTTWDLKGRPSDGPFLVTVPGAGTRVCVIVDHSWLAWLDPATEELKVWPAYPPGDALVGRPQPSGAALLVATEAGLVLTVDPLTGKEIARQTLEGSIAPATTPVPVGAKSLLLPLTDGTLMLVPK